MANLTKADCTAVALRVAEIVTQPLANGLATQLANLESEFHALAGGMTQELRVAKLPISGEQFTALLGAMDQVLAHVERLQERVAAVERRAGV